MNKWKEGLSCFLCVCESVWMSTLPLFSGPSSGLNLQHVDMCVIAAGDRCGVVMGPTDGTVRAGHTDVTALGAE